MSHGQKPRTPEYFPRMKYRARKRRLDIDRMFQRPTEAALFEWLYGRRLHDLADVAAELGIDLDEAEDQAA